MSESFRRNLKPLRENNKFICSLKEANLLYLITDSEAVELMLSCQDTDYKIYSKDEIDQFLEKSGITGLDKRKLFESIKDIESR